MAEPRVAILLSCHTFEQFYERDLGLTRSDYVASYRNEWSWEYAAVLKERGFEVALYLPSMKHSGAERTPDGYLVRFLPVGRAYRPWDRLPALRRSPVGRYVAETVNTLAFLSPLRKALKEDRVDVLYVQEYWTARFDILALARPIPIVAVEQSRPGKIQVAVLKRWTFRRAAQLHVQTESEERRLARYGARVERVANFVDTDFWRPDPGIIREEGLLLVVGRLFDEQKRISDAIRALALLPEPWHLVVIGRGPDREKLVRLAEDAGVAGRTTFRDFVASREDLRDAYRSCSVFALPSAHEGMPVALLEAMGCGTAIVATDIDGVREVVSDGENGLLVPVGRPDLFAAAIPATEAQQDEFGARARSMIEETHSRRAAGPRIAALLRGLRVPPLATPH